jgi:formate dehydrogenase
MPEPVIYTHCSICEQICGLAVETADGRIASIKPDKKNPYSWRDFCIKGARAGDIRDHTARILSPMKRVGDGYVATSYDEAINDIAARLHRLVDAHGPDAVGCYSGNPAGFAFSAHSFMNGFIDGLGSRSKFSVGSVDQNAVLVVADKMYGSETVTLLPDVDECDYFLLIGANPAVSKMNWMGRTPNGWKRVLNRVRAGAQLVVVDPRKTETAKQATRHVTVIPGQDWAYLLGLLHVIFTERLENIPYTDQIDNLEQLRQLAEAQDVAALAGRASVSADHITDVARGFARAKSAVAIARTGPAQSLNGTLAEWLSHALNFVTGRVDVRGGRYMPGWPMRLPDMARRQPKAEPRLSRVRGLPPVAGGYSLAELPDEIETPGDGQLRALFITGGNPVASGPNGARLDAALSKLDLLVSIDLFQRESHRHADWLIPGSHFLERSEVHVYLHSLNDEPFIMASKAVAPIPGDAIHEWRFVQLLADALGVELFGSAVETPDDLSAMMLAGSGLTLDEIRAAPHGLAYGERTLGHLWEHLADAERNVDLCPKEFAANLRERASTPAAAASASPTSYRLISKRRNATMNSWMADTLGVLKDSVTGDIIEIHPKDAERDGLADGDMVAVHAGADAVSCRLKVTDDIRQGVALIEHGWGSRVFDPAKGDVVFDTGVIRNRLVPSAPLDPFTGVPALNGAAVSIARISNS